MALSKILLDGGSTLGGIKEVEYKEVTNAGVDLRPGCVASAAVKVELFGEQETAVEAGDALSYYQIDKNGNETLIGVFYADPKIKTKNSYTITAHDAASKLSADFSAWLQDHQSDFPMTVYDLVYAACTVAGVTLGSASWPLSTQTVNAFYATGLTCRDIVSYAAEIACRFVRCHADGNLYFDWYTASTSTIAPSVGTNQYAYKQDGLSYANYETEAVARVAVHPSGEDDIAYIYPTDASGNTMHIKDNLLLTDADATFYNAVAQQVYTGLSAVGSYRAFDASLFPMENPFRAGDIVTATDIQGVTFTSPVMALTVNASAAKMESTGNETLSDDTNTRKELVQLASEVVRIKRLKVDWADIEQAIINYLTANNVTAQNITVVDENGDVLATFNSTGIILGEEEYGRAKIDYQSFNLYDINGNQYLRIGDERDKTGTSTRTEEFVAEQGQTIFTVSYSVHEILSVTKNGSPAHGYITRYNNVEFNTPMSGGEIIAITYTTKSALRTFAFTGTATGVGATSFCGTAKGLYTFVGGGQQNQAISDRAATLGGWLNEARGRTSAVVGGQNSIASGAASGVFGGSYNEASGNNSVILGGIDNKATHRSQCVFGEYNEIDPSTNPWNQRGTYIEIVGNGDYQSRSNARTLDWYGNETLAGDLVYNGDTSLSEQMAVTQSAPTITIENSSDNSYITKDGRVCSMFLSVNITAAINANAWTTIGTVAEKPKYNQQAIAKFGNALAQVRITTNGNILIASDVSNPQGTVAGLRGQIVWFY